MINYYTGVAAVLLAVHTPTFDGCATPAAGEVGDTTNMGTALNTEYHEAFSTITSDELTMYFASDRPGGAGPSDPTLPWQIVSYDLYVAHRETPTSPWGAPVRLSSNINTSASEHSVSETPDGHYIYFASDQRGGCGGFDIYVSYRADPTDDMGWEPAVNLGCEINGPYIDSCPAYHVNDNGTAKLYYTRSNLGSPPETFFDQLLSLDFFVSVHNTQNGTFGTPTVLNHSTIYQDSHFDPNHGFVWGEYPGGFGSGDIWLSTKENGETNDPVNMGPYVNTEYEEQIPSASADGLRLYFASNRPGGYGGLDLYMAEAEGSSSLQ